MKPGGWTPHSQGLSNNRQINLIPRIDTYFFKIQSNIVLPSTPKPYPGLFPVLKCWK